MVKIEQQVKKKSKRTTKLLKIFMIIAAILFLLLGIVFSTGYMLFCFIFAGMYFWFDSNADKEYEYVYCDGKLSIYVIKAKRKKIEAHVLDLASLEVVAPHEHESVRMYKKGMGEDLPKYDYTSYEDDIPYYTMIIFDNNQKVKILLDLNQEMLIDMKRKYPTKVFM